MVGGNANYLDLTSFVAHGMRSLDNSCLFNGDNDDMEILSKAESVISDASTMESAQSGRTGGCGRMQLRSSNRGCK